MSFWCLRKAALVTLLGASLVLGTARDAASGESKARGDDLRPLARVGEVVFYEAEVEARAAARLEVLSFQLLQAQAVYQREAHAARTQALRELIEEELRRAEAQKREAPPRESTPPAASKTPLAELWLRGRVEVLFEPFRSAVSRPDAPSRGPASAPVTLVEFADFECSHCAGLAPTLRAVGERFGPRVRLEFRHFPLATSGQTAFEAAELTFCAGEQGKFWQLHDHFFREQQRLGAEGPLSVAAELDVGYGALRDCLETHRWAERVRGDRLDAARAGVVGTPTLFVNGLYLPGNVPLERLMEVIEQELARLGG